MSDASSKDATSPTQCLESYRSKEAVGPSEAAQREATAILNGANDAIARRAQNPEQIAGTRIGKACPPLGRAKALDRHSSLMH